MGELTHGDVGQMDGSVGMYDGLFTEADDNPTIGLILSTEQNETVARYSVLSDRKQIFASFILHPSYFRLGPRVEAMRRLSNEEFQMSN